MKKFKMMLASYKNSKSVFGGLIRFKQKYINKLSWRYARISHSEVVFCYNDDTEGLELLEKLENVNGENFIKSREKQFEDFNLWFSSEEGVGARFKFIEDNKNHWVFKEFEVSRDEYIKALKFAIKENNNAYNWFGIFFNQTLKLNWFRKKGDWFCSQISGRILQELNGKNRIESLVGVDMINVSPGKLAELCDNFKN